MCGRAFDEGGDTALGALFAQGDAQVAAAGFVDIVRLGVPGLAATVDHVVELFTIGAVEDAGEMFYNREAGCQYIPLVPTMDGIHSQRSLAGLHVRSRLASA